MGFGVPVSRFFPAHLGDALTDLVDTIAPTEGFCGLEDEFELSTRYLVETHGFAGCPRSPLDSTRSENFVDSAGDPTGAKSLDPNVALVTFEVRGLQLYGQHSSVLITIHGADVLFSAAHSASVMMPTVAFEGPVSAARR